MPMFASLVLCSDQRAMITVSSLGYRSGKSFFRLSLMLPLQGISDWLLISC